MPKGFVYNQTLSQQNTGRTIAVGDVHGCLRTLRKLVEERIRLDMGDTLILLGDYIHRGPYSGQVLDYLMALQHQGYRVYPLRGNHEHYLLQTLTKRDENLQHYLEKYQAYELLPENGGQPYIDFISSLPYYIETEKFYLVHAGFNFSAPNPFCDYESMLYIRDYEPNAAQLNGKKIIHGHQPQHLRTIQMRVWTQAERIPLDNGIALLGPHPEYDYTQMGNLCALDLNNFQLFVQPNIDMPRQ